MKNFARVWRPRQFDTVLGQELAVKLLKNSVYCDKIFPVYIFIGQHGSGKTSLARIFAAALNCTQIPQFRTTPHATPLPCQRCISCQAMLNDTHTDFMEIDAASHTGVDNVRAIIEAASFAPQIGSKKVYLIDEAHMLSKAACNALLKTLEEPIASVVFLMATTDIHKIPDTVRSRCFQLFLTPHSAQDITNHLALICTKENIMYDQEAIEQIAQGANGSLRDALNMLERVAIAYGKIDISELRSLTGMLTLHDIFSLCSALAQRTPEKALELIQSQPYILRGVPGVWHLLYEGLRLLLLYHYKALPAHGKPFHEAIHALSTHYSPTRIRNGLQLLYSLEQQMLKTMHQQALLEVVIVQLCEESATTSTPQPRPALSREPLQSAPAQKTTATLSDSTPNTTSAAQQLWQQCSIKLKEALHISIARQGIATESEMNQFVVTVPASCHILDPVANGLHSAAQEELRKATSRPINLTFQFSPELSSTTAARPLKAEVQPALTAIHTAQPPAKRNTRNTSLPSESASISTDPIAKKALELFPGTLTMSTMKITSQS